jgi:EpsI family protein
MNSRFLTVVLLLTATAVLIQVRGNSDQIPASEPLGQMPRMISDWSGNEMQIDQESLDVLGAGDFLSRVYVRGADPQPIDLFVGYFPTQRTGVSIHSPSNCLPSSGWAFESSHYLNLMDASGKPHRVGEYIITDGEHRQFVIYWYQSHGRSIASEYLAKLYLVIDAIRMNRTDGALVRVATPISPAEGSARAKARAESFTSQLVPVLPRFIPD